MTVAEAASELSEQVLCEIGWGAATLAERLAALGNVSPGPIPADPPLLTRWRRLLAVEDAQVLSRRLGWDGLTEARVAAALNAPTPRSWTSPEWTTTLRGLVDEASLMARGTDAVHPSSPAVPFLELWSACVRVGRCRLRASPELDVTQALGDLERALIADVVRVGEPVVFDAWNVFRSEHAASAGTYPAFMRQLLAGGLLCSLAVRYPLWARDVIAAVHNWVDATNEMLERLSADRTALAAAFELPADRLVEVEASLSDPHAGGRRVAILRFASGLRLVYKPRDVGLEAAFQRVLLDLAARGLQAAAPALRIVERDGYGWAEYAQEGSFPNEESVRAYYRRTGSLLALAHVLGARDLHQENIVATSAGPILVDAEMLLQPSSREGPLDSEADFASSLGTGLLNWWHSDQRGGLFDVGGVRPATRRTRTLPGRGWSGLDTDELALAPETSYVPRAHNRVLLNGRAAPPEDFVEECVSGFDETYGFLVAQRDVLLAASGVLGDLTRQRTRVLFRPSNQYGAFLHLLATPGRQGLGVDRSVAVEALGAVFAQDKHKPRLWPLAVDERAALERLDVPRFSVPVDETALQSDGGARVEGHFTESGLEAARRRLLGLHDRDRARQVALVRAALMPSLPDSGPSTASDPLVAAAELLGRSLLEHARNEDDGGLSWQPFTASADLYRGQAGIALFLSALAAARPERREWADAAARARRAIASSKVGSSLGAGTGVGSVVYGLLWCARIGGDTVALEQARRLAAGVTPERIAAERELDVEGGVAGFLLALLALQAETADPSLLDLAIACGRRLVDAQQTAEPAGAAWPARDGALNAGFAHGAAGIASALARLHAVAPDANLAAAVRAAHAYERSRFSAGAGNWAHLRGQGGAVWLMAWCHGAPGVALARASAPAVQGDAEGREADIVAAAAATRSAKPSAHDHLCCGSLGQADVLLSVGRSRGDEDLVGRAREMAQAVAARILARGFRGARVTGFEQQVYQPGFFRGLSGIGYQLLRTAAPERLPSVLAFEAPTPRSLA
jgi:type 2 lantibiotic biosynthesis protein LanM